MSCPHSLGVYSLLKPFRPTIMLSAITQMDYQRLHVQQWAKQYSIITHVQYQYHNDYNSS